MKTVPPLRRVGVLSVSVLLAAALTACGDDAGSLVDQAGDAASEVPVDLDDLGGVADAVGPDFIRILGDALEVATPGVTGYEVTGDSSITLEIDDSTDPATTCQIVTLAAGAFEETGGTEIAISLDGPDGTVECE